MRLCEAKSFFNSTDQCRNIVSESELKSDFCNEHLNICGYDKYSSFLYAQKDIGERKDLRFSCRETTYKFCETKQKVLNCKNIHENLLDCFSIATRVARLYYNPTMEHMKYINEYIDGIYNKLNMKYYISEKFMEEEISQEIPLWETEEFIAAIRYFDEHSYGIAKPKGNQFTAENAAKQLESTYDFKQFRLITRTLKCFPAKIPAVVMYHAIEAYSRDGLESELFHYLFIENDTEMRQADLYAAMLKAEDRNSIHWIDGWRAFGSTTRRVWKTYKRSERDKYVNPKDILTKINVEEYRNK